MRRRIVIAAVAALVLLGIGAAYVMNNREAAVPVYQGWVEADFLFIGADEPGRLTQLQVKEGDTVKQGAELFAVQSDIQDAEWNQAKAALEEAQARLARLEAAQQRPEEIAVLQAAEASAKAALAYSKADYERARTLVERGVAAQARLDQAKSAYERDQAALEQIQRQIHFGRIASRTEDIEAARFVVSQAQGRVAAAETRRQQRTVFAPAPGRIQEVYFRPGEIVPSGRPVVALLPPGNVKLRFFVPQSELPKVAYGQPVRVTCDGCPGEITGRVSFISAQAEYTPPVIYSLEERARLVFRIEAKPDNPELLRVGQPIQVALEPRSGTETAGIPRQGNERR